MSTVRSAAPKLTAAAALLGLCATAALGGAPAQARPRLVHAGVNATTGSTGTSGSTGSSGSTGPSGVTGSTGSTGSGGTGSTGTAAANPSTSSNWAGYAVRSSGSVARHFTRITGSWIAPAVTCTPGSAAYSAFWVGLGGYTSTAKHLEQVGTEADCDAHGVAHYSAWFELVPRASVTVALAVAPGDAITAAVKATPGAITFTLTDTTSGARFHRRIAFTGADTTSAEWIAEAPSSCGANGCRTLPLGDFGTVTFTGASVATHSGLRGPISAAKWSAVPIALDAQSGSPRGDQFALGSRALISAVPSVLADAGSSFGVSWEQQAPPVGP